MSGAPTPRVPGALARLLPLAVAGSALLMLASGALFYYASQTAPPAAEGTVRKVVVGDRSCEPSDITVPAGRTIFEIRNASNRTLEWEILDGVMVVEERENIAPGFRATLTARLKPGRYQITCGLLSNPRGTLIVTASAESEAERTRPPLTSFIGPLSEYRVYSMIQAAALARETKHLADAIRSGDIGAARGAYVAARLPYRRLDMVTGRFSDLKNMIDPLADYLAGREEDPAFTGFHRIEYGLFAKGSLEGLQPVVDRLSADVSALAERIKALRLAPEDLATGASRQALFLAQGQILKGENRYAARDLEEFEAAFEGMAKSLDLLLPLGSGPTSAAAREVGAAQADLRGQFGGLKRDGAYPGYGQVPADARERLAHGFTALAEAAAKLNTSLGLD